MIRQQSWDEKLAEALRQAQTDCYRHDRLDPQNARWMEREALLLEWMKSRERPRTRPAEGHWALYAAGAMLAAILILMASVALFAPELTPREQCELQATASHPMIRDAQLRQCLAGMR